MLLQVILLAALAMSPALAIPVASTSSSTKATPVIPLQQIAASNTGSLALPTPTTSPIAIALGVGHQNYTCNTTSQAYVQTVAGSGALARLYNATKYLDQHPENVTTLPTVAYQHAFPSSSKRDCPYEHEHDMSWGSVVLGLHYFDYADRPTFNLTGLDPPAVLSAKKQGDVKAPTAGNIDWLYLVDANDGISRGNVKSVYRVETVGGTAPSSCDASSPATISIPYTAEYWFYA